AAVGRPGRRTNLPYLDVYVLPTAPSNAYKLGTCRMSASPALVISSLIAALGGLLFGFDTVVISGAEQRLEEIFSPAHGLDPWWQRFWHGTLTASALVGTVMGSLAVGRPCDWWGRRYVMFWLAILYFVSAVGSALAWDWYSMVFFRW